MRFPWTHHPLISAAQGLPAALDGAKKLRVGVEQLRAGLGAPEADGTILNGLAKIGGGLSGAQGGLGQLAAGLPAAKGGVDAVKTGIDTKMLPGLGSPTVPAQTIRFAVESVRQGLAAGSTDGASLDQLLAVVNAIGAALGCTTPYPAPPQPPTTPCESVATLFYGISQIKTNSAAGATALAAAGDGLTGIVKGLRASSDGLGAVSTGLGSAVGGASQLQAGVSQLQAGNAAVTAVRGRSRPGSRAATRPDPASRRASTRS